jgi:hypothetical protein
MDRLLPNLVLISTLLAACSGQVAPPVNSPTGSPPQAGNDPDLPTVTIQPALDSSATISTPPSLPGAEEPPGQAVSAALTGCISPECEYPRQIPGSRRLAADSATAGDRWCVQAYFTLEGQQQQVAVIVGEVVGSNPTWRPGEPMVGVGCETVE